jgi:hypothetical protein
MTALRGAWLAPALLLAAGCSQQAEEPEQTAQTFHEVMKDEVDVRADVVWAVGNAAIGERGGIDPAKMNDAAWDKLAEGADSLEQAALKIAAMDPLVVTRPGVKILDEDEPLGDKPVDIQARFDRDPQALRDMANTLAAHSREIATAARAHDAARAGTLVDELDGVCEGCHVEFWYPSQKPLIDQIRNSGL